MSIPAPFAMTGSPQREARHSDAWWRGWGPLEWFIVVQYLSTALLFVPGAQSIRIIIRTLPYLLGGVMFFVTGARVRREFMPAGAGLIGLAMLTLVVNMLRPTSQPIAGLAQVALQLCIASPLFWAAAQVRSPKHFYHAMLLIIACNAVSASVGILQVYWPDTFLPGEFNQMALAKDAKLLTSLSYIGTDGQRIVRPPGLTDMPGGAAGPGMLCALFGIAFAARPQATPRQRVLLLAVAAIGFACLFLTQVRSILIMTVVALSAFALLAVRQRRPVAALYTAGFGTLLVVGAFTYAVGVGGEAIETRFLSVTDQGLVESYQRERGGFLRHTFANLLPEYPFGAGVGRWGVMNMYFGDQSLVQAKAIYVEIQLTGWLLDGGIFMWLFYGGGVAMSLWTAVRVAQRRELGEVGYLAAAVFCAQLMIAGMAFAGPAFNTQLGVQFWTFAAALQAAVVRQRMARAPAALPVALTAARAP
jgi:hypothetical protein